MSDGSLASAFVPASAIFAAGIVFGLGYFKALRSTVELYGTRRVTGPAVLTLARLVSAALFFGLAGRLGTFPLFGALLGFQLARAVAMYAMRRAG